MSDAPRFPVEVGTYTDASAVNKVVRQDALDRTNSSAHT